MDNHGYGGIQWIQHHSVNHSGDMKTAGQLLIDPQPPRAEDLMASANSSSSYMATEDDETDSATIDQIAAENLIFMARDGQMVTEIITNATTDKDGNVVVTASDGEQIDCDAIMEQAALIQQHEDAGGGVYSVEHFTENTPQMVTEEVITDDWVQHQGEERVEIPAEQIIGSSSQVLLDIEVPLPTVQDEYTALRPYPCDFCSRRFRKKASLMNHMVAHQTDRPHLCKLCGARFLRRQDLINHLKGHAEEPVDDSDFIHFVNDTTSSSQRTSNDHYYEQDWIVPEDSVTIPTKSSRKQQQIQQQEQHITSLANQQIIMDNNSMTLNVTTTPSDSLCTQTTTSAPPRGRISRLKPKEDSYVVEVPNNCSTSDMIISSAYSIVECDTLSANTAAVKLTQDSTNALQTSNNQQPNVLHYPVIDDSKPFVCQQCGLAFSREKAMLSHTKTHKNDSPYECPHCNELFWDQSSLQDHQKTHQFEESNSEYDPNEGEDETQTESESEQQLYGEFYCSECGMSFHRQDLLKRHAKCHAKENSSGHSNTTNGLVAKDQHCCNTCGETFAEALDLLAHAEIHARYPPFKCVLCGESFFEESTIKKHLQSQHSNELTENSCILCGKECRDRKALMKHAWDHSREKCHSCSKCGKNFHNKARLKRHMASHRDKSVQCDVCHEEFPDGRTLSNHRHSHSATSAGKLFPCLECGKTFGSRSSQQIHVRIHTGERPYGCRFCWKAFADGGTLRKHERIHTGEKPYACSVCPRAFNQRVVLREHIRSHHSGLDAKRGTYYCTVCGAELSSSGDLIQHLIQHSDMNTAMQRQPVTGPRKYKRRRKLKPHELARLKRECKQNGGNGSDIDLSDFDMDNVDDLLAITTDSNTATEIQTTTSDALQAKSTKRKSASASSSHSEQHNNSKTKTSNHKGKSNLLEDFDLDVELEDDAMKKQLFNSTSSDKIWPSKQTEDTYKSLLSNLETTLQSIDTLVVEPSTRTSNNRNTDVQAHDHTQTKRRPKQETASTAQRTQQVRLSRGSGGGGAGGGKETISPTGQTRGRKSKNAAKQAKRPQMIHTEKATSEGNAISGGGGLGGSKKKSKSIISRTQSSNIDILPKTSTIVDDYDIISPASHPPKQISSSPLHIKQEHDNRYHQQLHHDHHQLQNQQQHNHLIKNPPNTNHNTSARTQSTTRHTNANDLYDAHLLLEASGLRNDLDEILRSPLKADKLRQRFTSESSTQFLAEQSEEEQHLIKIEPTSPDLREIVNGASSVNANAAELDVTTAVSKPRRSNKSSRSKRAINTDCKYIEFTSDIPSSETTNNISKRSQMNSHSTSAATKTSKSARTEPAKSLKSIQNSNAAAASSYLDYTTMVDTFSTVTSSSTNNNSSFASISAVVSAADASAAAQQQNSSSANRKPQRYFECEMCCAIFSDRAQLLDHVPIHI